jgi:hypothetical protein
LAVKNLVARWFLTFWLGVAVSLVPGNSLALAAGGRSGADQAVPLKMAFRDGNLTAEIVAAPLHEVMAEISKLTGAEVRWLGQHENERVSSTFTGVPLHEALERILKKNFTLSYAASGVLTDIWILPRANGEEPEARLQVAAATERLIAVDEGRTNPPTGRNQPPARMAPEVGIKGAPAASSPGIDIAKQSLPARREAVALLAMHADKDEAAREILSHVASTDADPHVREIASMALLGLK